MCTEYAFNVCPNSHGLCIANSGKLSDSRFLSNHTNEIRALGSESMELRRSEIHSSGSTLDADLET